MGRIHCALAVRDETRTRKIEYGQILISSVIIM